MNVLIVYNPNSTGGSKENALALARTLRAVRRDDLPVKVMRTTHAGHIEEIARKQAKSGKPSIIVSSSGDGGYHELINGVLSVKNSKVITGLLPSGNANDHHTALSRGDIVRDILTAKYQRIDILKISATIQGKPWIRYAHSYIGIGISSHVAGDLTKKRPNVLSEKWLVLKALISFKWIKIIRRGRPRHYSSIIFSNINRMSKMLKLSENEAPNDGKFEVNSIRFRSKPFLLLQLLRAGTIGMKSYRTTATYRFTTVRPLRIQMDGETYRLDAHSSVVIESARASLDCVL